MKELGLNALMLEFLEKEKIEMPDLGRIVIEHKERYIVQIGQSTYHGEITGNLRYTAESRRDFPAVGDWVRTMKMDDENLVITEVLPRRTLLERQAVGKHAETQIIAANIDTAFITTSVGHDFSLNRIERYLFLCNTGNIDACLILTKIDLLNTEELEELVQKIRERIPNIPVMALSNVSGHGLKELDKFMKPYNTYCFLGSSGVGKSTIINSLSGQEQLKTSAISSTTNKGRHTTSHRELIILPNKSIVIDTAGMREIGMTDSEDGIDKTFSEISELAENCRFSDCTHTNEKGCAVLHAMEEGILNPALFENYHKMKREQQHFSSTVHEKRQKDKEFGKMVKSVLNEKKKFKM